MPSGSSAPAYPEFAADDPKISAYLAHLAHVGDEMAAGLGALFAEKFPEVPALGVIHEGFQFSKNDSLLLFAGLDGDALTLEKRFNSNNKIKIHGANGRVVVARYFVGLVKAE